MKDLRTEALESRITTLEASLDEYQKALKRSVDLIGELNLQDARKLVLINSLEVRLNNQEQKTRELESITS